MHNTSGSNASPARRNSPRRKPRSKLALCATNSLPFRRSNNAGAMTSKVGAPRTIAFVMPVSCWMNEGIGCCGSTRLLQRDTPAGPISTTPTSVMRCSLVEPPVVSRSTKTIGTSRAGCGRNCSDMEKDTLDAWLCGKYAPVSRCAPSQYCFALSSCGAKTAFLHDRDSLIKPLIIIFLCWRF